MSIPTGNVVKLSHRNVAKLGGWDRILDAFTGPTGNVVKLSHRNVAKLGGWDRILDAMGGMHWSSVSYPTPT